MAESKRNVIKFYDDFGLIILKFIQYFSITMFTIGCAMVILSLERNKILPYSFLILGVFIILFLIAEKNLYQAGYTEIDLDKKEIAKRHFFFRKNLFDLNKIEYLTVESVFSSNMEVILYNIFMRVDNKTILLGQEREQAAVYDKTRKILKATQAELKKTSKYLEKNDLNQVVKLVFIVITLLFFVLFLKTKSHSSPFIIKNLKIVIVIAIPISYFILINILKNQGKR